MQLRRKTYDRQFKNFEIGLGNFGKIKVDLKGVRQALGASADLMDSVIQASFVNKIEKFIYQKAVASSDKEKQFGQGGKNWLPWSPQYRIWRKYMGYSEGGKIGVQTGELKETLQSQPEKIYQRVLVAGSPEKGAGIRLTLRNAKLQPDGQKYPTAYPLFFHVKRPYTPTPQSLEKFMIREARNKIFQYPIIARHFGFS